MTPAPSPPPPWHARLAAVVTELVNVRTDLCGEVGNLAHGPDLGPDGLLALVARIEALREQLAGLAAGSPRGSVRLLARARKLLPGGRNNPLTRAARTRAAGEARAVVADVALAAHEAIKALAAIPPEGGQRRPAPPPGAAPPAAEARPAATPLPPPPPAPPEPPARPADQAVVVVELAGFRRNVAGLIDHYECHANREQRAHIVDFYQNWFDTFVWEAVDGVVPPGPHRVFAALGPAMCLSFGSASEAYRFARAVAERAAVHNRDEGADGPHTFHFRFSLGWGKVRFRTPPAARSDPARPYTVGVGEPVVVAHHLYRLARTGELLVHADAYSELVRTDVLGGGPVAPVDFPGATGDPPCTAHRVRLADPAPWDAG